MAVTAIAGLIGTAPLLGIGAADDSDGLLHVQVLAVNDFHGHIEPDTPGTVSTRRGRVRAGGIEFLAAHIEARRADNPNTVVVSAGDLIGASPFVSAFFHDEPTIEGWNRAGLDFNAVGNHEFDEGRDELARMQQGGCHPEDGCRDGDGFAGARFGFLAANVRGADGRTVFPPYGIRTFAGAQVAFVGLTLEGTSGFLSRSAAAGLTFEDEAATVNRLVPLLREQGVQAIVVLLHEGGRQAGGYDGCDGIAGPVIEVVKRTDPEVDVFVTGHTHRAYVCEIDGRLVTSAGSYGRILTDIDLAIDPATGDIVSAEAANEIVTHDVARHPRLSSLVARYRRLAAPLENRVVGSLAATVDRLENEAGESALGDLVADAQAAATGADVAFVHADGIRADLEAGDVTYGEAFAVQPFGHRLVTMTLTGAEIDAVLEEQWLGQPFPRLLAASAGLRYSRDPEAAPGRRVEFATTTLAGRPLRPERRYRVTVNEFLADGGNDFATFATGTDRELGPTDVDALARLLRRGVSGYTEPEGRVTRRSAGATVVAVGDIASCLQTGDEATAEVVREIDPDAVLTLGDNVYPSGTPEEFAECYDPSWGRFLDRTHPAPGNHDYATPEAAGYFGYFGSRAPGPYYSFDLGDWHLVSLNTEINRNWDSPQLRWLRRDLRTDDHRCELLYWHRARWSGGSHGSSEYSQPLWRAAYEAGVDLVLVGHDHNYQRFPRLDARGRPDPSFGVVQIVAGTGGRGHYDAGEIAHRVVADEATFGVLKLRLGPRGYSLRFVPVAGGSFSDVVRGGRCHGAPPRG